MKRIKDSVFKTCSHLEVYYLHHSREPYNQVLRFLGGEVRGVFTWDQQCCGRCHHFYHREAGAGDCRRLSPRAAGWPAINFKDYCSEFEKAWLFSKDRADLYNWVIENLYVRKTKEEPAGGE